MSGLIDSVSQACLQLTNVLVSYRPECIRLTSELMSVISRHTHAALCALVASSYHEVYAEEHG